ncbi:MAG TPA: M17 family metallopeptidase [Spirochaetota bacterium]|nr:M17 family metallopeptidase [Spirochaetota bacterium]HOM38034.1 M17 family metallopeptidase [Spirochaetota bacterium]HPQ48838.1 M17 family metallopeptidase [Spirochaetota bacterium]
MFIFNDKNYDISIKFFYETSKIPSFLKDIKVFEGKESQSYFDAKMKVLYIGLGKRNNDKMILFKATVNGFRSIKDFSFEKVNIILNSVDKNDILFVIEALFVARFSFSMKKDEKNRTIVFIFDSVYKNYVEEAYKIAEARNFVRKLVDMPSNMLTTNEFVNYIENRLKNLNNIDIKVLDYDQLIKENFAGLIAVGKGSLNPPFFVKIKYEPKSYNKTISLIGKGIVFDSGGLSLKPTESMLDMKGDMAGAATVVGIIEILSKNNIGIKVNAYVPIAENMISGHSYKIGDIITYRNGKSVEITNTDAEGRLILADAIIEANKDDSSITFVVATLTGACMVALGTHIYGVFSSDVETGKVLVDFVNKKTSEKAWLLPLFEPYKENLKSKIADIKNASSSRWGGAINAALFLKEFVENKKFIHLDIAGPFYDDGIGIMDKMATGIPVESLYMFLSKYFI